MSHTPVGLAPLGAGCPCVTEHSPRAYVPELHHVTPQSWGGLTVPENLQELCPNTHTATHRLLDEYVRHGGLPPWETRRHFGLVAQALADRGWEQRPAVPTLTLAYDETGRPLGFVSPKK